jgi:uncharacterized membrane protein YhaH (DUF805 family)
MYYSREQGVNMLAIFSLRGRTTRLGYWRVQLCAMVVTALSLLVALPLLSAIGPMGAAPLVLFPIALAAVLATVLRRLHDRGKGPLWWLLFVLGPFAAGSFYQMVFDSGDSATILKDVAVILIVLAIIIWAFIEIGLAPGERTANRFGEPVSIDRGARFLSKGWWA